MKYYTKEWIALLEQSHYAEKLVEDSNASTYSEKYYEKVYKRELRKWITLQKEIYNISKEIEDIETPGPYNEDEQKHIFHNNFLEKLNVIKEFFQVKF